MLNPKTYKPIRTITRKGKFLVGILRLLFKARRVLGGNCWEHPLKDHHEDPRKMTRSQQVFLGYKYFYRAIIKGDKGSGIEQHFQMQAVRFNPPKSKSNTKKITLSAGGDLMPYYCITPNQCQQIWDDSGDFFFNADLVVGNLETPINPNKTASFVPEVMLSNMYFNASQEMFDVFSGLGKYKGFDLLSTANNHSLDQGEEGIIKTIEFLEHNGLAHVGTARNEVEREAFPIKEINGIKIAFLSYTFSLNALVCPEDKTYLVNHLNLNEAHPDILLMLHQTKVARERGAEFIVAFLHMGCAYQPYPSAQIVANMHSICKQTGIDLVLGGHPHNAQPIEFVDIIDPISGKEKQCTIVYSQGDFIAYDIFKWCRLPLLLKFEISKINNQVVITDLKAKLYYNYAKIKNGRVDSLQLLDFQKLSKSTEILKGDKNAIMEFEELKIFAESFILNGNLERFLIN